MPISVTPLREERWLVEEIDATYRAQPTQADVSEAE